MYSYKGYTARVEFDDATAVFHGEVLGIRDVVTFRGRNDDELAEAFRSSVDEYLEFCRERGGQPEKPVSAGRTVR